MAMALFADLVIKRGMNIDAWRIESAGCWAMSGLPATTSAITTVSARGLDLTGHRSQPITESLLDEFNLILCMAYDHKSSLQRNFPSNAAKIFLLSEMVATGKEVDDPVGLSIGIYQTTAVEILGYLQNGFDKIFELSG